MPPPWTRRARRGQPEGRRGQDDHRHQPRQRPWRASASAVLILDIDPQGNASTGLGVPRSQRTTTIYDLVLGERQEARCWTHGGGQPPCGAWTWFPPTPTCRGGGDRAEAGRRRSVRTRLRDSLMAIPHAIRYALQLCADRLPALAESFDGQRHDRGGCGARAAAVRVLRPGGADPAMPETVGAGAGEPQSRTWQSNWS